MKEEKEEQRDLIEEQREKRRKMKTDDYKLQSIPTNKIFT